MSGTNGDGKKMQIFDPKNVRKKKRCRREVRREASTLAAGSQIVSPSATNAATPSTKPISDANAFLADNCCKSLEASETKSPSSADKGSLPLKEEKKLPGSPQYPENRKPAVLSPKVVEEDVKETASPPCDLFVTRLDGGSAYNQRSAGVDRDGDTRSMRFRLRNLDHITSRELYIDSHVHLDYMRYYRLSDGSVSQGHFDRYEEMEQLFEKLPDTCMGVVWNVVNPANLCRDRNWIMRMIKETPKILGLSVGCHPKSVDEWEEFKCVRSENFLTIVNGKMEFECSMRSFVANMLNAKSKYKVCAIGECGLDTSLMQRGRTICPMTMQKCVFIEQLRLARRHRLPVILHCRGDLSVEKEMLRLIQEELSEWHTMHRHCFDGNAELAKKWMDALPNCYFGFTPMILANSETIRKTVEYIPLSRVVLETDAPFFATDAYRMSSEAFEKGVPRMSCPAQASTVAYYISQVKGIPLDVVMQTTRMNTLRLYGLDRIVDATEMGSDTSVLSP